MFQFAQLLKFSIQTQNLNLHQIFIYLFWANIFWRIRCHKQTNSKDFENCSEILSIAAKLVHVISHIKWHFRHNGETALIWEIRAKHQTSRFFIYIGCSLHYREWWCIRIHLPCMSIEFFSRMKIRRSVIFFQSVFITTCFILFFVSLESSNSQFNNIFHLLQSIMALF
jgi:hypothetical protein